MRGAHATALAFQAFFNVGKPPQHAVPGTHLTVSYENVCTSPATRACDSTIWYDVYDIRASRPEGSLGLRPGETGTLGEYRITNVRNTAKRVRQDTPGASCVIDSAVDLLTTVLHPTRVQVDD